MFIIVFFFLIIVKIKLLYLEKINIIDLGLVFKMNEELFFWKGISEKEYKDDVFFVVF